MITKFKIYENWKDQVDPTKIYVYSSYSLLYNTTTFNRTIIGKMIPERFSKNSKRIRAYHLQGYYLDNGEPTPKITDQNYHGTISYYEWKDKEIREATPEEIEKYYYYDNVNKYNL